MTIFKPKIANLSFQRVPGQDLAENGPFACIAHKEIIKKNATSFPRIGHPKPSTCVKKNNFSFKRVTLARWSILASKWLFLASKWQFLI